MARKRSGGNSGLGRAPFASSECSASLPDLEIRIGHDFADKALLRRALTHASADTNASNERLEFLGDRVLGLIVAERIYALYPGDREGDLALKFNALARRETCAQAALAAGLSAHLILAAAEAVSGGRRKLAILSGACEAVIAALYLDGGMAAARGFIDRFWGEAFAALNTDMRDAKTILQEWAQGHDQNRGMPNYRLVGRQGPDHAPHFMVEVDVEGLDPQQGCGGSKREAEQDAAAKLLERLGLKS
jgi:ribonuclease III